MAIVLEVLGLHGLMQGVLLSFMHAHNHTSKQVVTFFALIAVITINDNQYLLCHCSQYDIIGGLDEMEYY